VIKQFFIPDALVTGKCVIVFNGCKVTLDTPRKKKKINIIAMKVITFWYNHSDEFSVILSQFCIILKM